MRLPSHSLSYLKSHRSQAKSLVTAKKGTITLTFGKCGKEDQGNYRLIRLTSGKITELVLLDVILRHMQDREVI